MELGANREKNIDPEVEAAFNQHYLAEFTECPPFVRLESEIFPNHLTCIIFISVLQTCTSKANVLTSLT
jgi:hypothetical protein